MEYRNFRREIDSKSIPSKVFFNHFFAIRYCIESDSNKFNLKKLTFYNHLKNRNPNINIEEIKKLLWNSWSTEYAYGISQSIDNNEYYKFSLHWNFPQAYYSTYLALTAFHETQNCASDQHEKSIKLFGNSTKDGHYPKAISYFVMGLKNDFSYFGFEAFKQPPLGRSVLSNIDCLEDAEYQLATFLKTTRENNAKDKKERLEKQNDKKFHNASGKFRESFAKEHWDMVYKTIPVTSIFNLLYRLRIKANYRDIESFINADIDFKSFNTCLGEMVFYLNFVHEAYIAKCIGIVEYENILNTFPGHLNENTALKRFNEYIKPLN